MSRAYQCDRCYSFYKNRGEIDILGVIISFDNGYKQELDLCPKCAYEFEKWFKNKVEVEVKLP